jgi:hypothetical protein
MTMGMWLPQPHHVALSVVHGKQSSSRRRAEGGSMSASAAERPYGGDK